MVSTLPLELGNVSGNFTIFRYAVGWSPNLSQIVGGDDPTKYRKMVKVSEKLPNSDGNVLTMC